MEHLYYFSNALVPSLYLVAVLDTYETHTIEDLTMQRASQAILKFAARWKEMTLFDPTCTAMTMPASTFLTALRDAHQPIGVPKDTSDLYLLHHCRKLKIKMNKADPGTPAFIDGVRTPCGRLRGERKPPAGASSRARAKCSSALRGSPARRARKSVCCSRRYASESM